MPLYDYRVLDEDGMPFLDEDGNQPKVEVFQHMRDAAYERLGANVLTPATMRFDGMRCVRCVPMPRLRPDWDEKKGRSLVWAFDPNHLDEVIAQVPALKGQIGKDGVVVWKSARARDKAYAQMQQRGRDAVDKLSKETGVDWGKRGMADKMGQRDAIFDEYDVSKKNVHANAAAERAARAVEQFKEKHDDGTPDDVPVSRTDHEQLNRDRIARERAAADQLRRSKA